MNKKTKLPEVKITNADAVPAEVIANSIVEIADGMRKLSATRLTRRAIVALIYDFSKVAKRDIEIVLNNLESLEKHWLKPKDTKS